MELLELQSKYLSVEGSPAIPGSSMVNMMCGSMELRSS